MKSRQVSISSVDPDGVGAANLGPDDLLEAPLLTKLKSHPVSSHGWTNVSSRHLS